MTTTTKDKKIILYLHGLESGPNGTKATYLRNNFSQDETIVLIPDLEMSLWNLNKRNSLPRNNGSLSDCLVGCVDLTLHYLKQQLQNLTKTASTSSNGTTIIEEQPDNVQQQQQQQQQQHSFFFTRAEKYLIQNNLIVIGSSWGGATALKLLSSLEMEMSPPYRVLLLAPALGACGYWLSWMWPEWSPDTLPENSITTIMVIHGDQDNIIPVECSRKFVEKFSPRVEYLEVAGGDHRLYRWIHETGRLKEIIDSWVAKT